MRNHTASRWLLTAAALIVLAGAAAQVRISEIHYDNTGTDTGEAIEISAPAGTDLTGWTRSCSTTAPVARVTYTRSPDRRRCRPPAARAACWSSTIPRTESRTALPTASRWSTYFDDGGRIPLLRRRRSTATNGPRSATSDRHRRARRPAPRPIWHSLHAMPPASGAVRHLELSVPATQTARHRRRVASITVAPASARFTVGGTSFADGVRVRYLESAGQRRHVHLDAARSRRRDGQRDGRRDGDCRGRRGHRRDRAERRVRAPRRFT